MNECLQYVTSAPFFWQTMAITTASSIFLGALLYNGDLKKLAKGLVAIVPYIALLTATTVVRIRNVEIVSPKMAYAGLITIGFITFFYILGLVLGVITTMHVHKLRKK